MNINYPHTIHNSTGEIAIFEGVVAEPDGERLYGENFVAPGGGPPMHVHWLQDECFTVVKGRIGYQIQGQKEQYASAGETILFERGVAHRFWNAGTDTLQCKSWIKPANTMVFFLSAIFNAQNKSGKAQPELFDVAYLLTRYGNEYDMLEIPWLIRKGIFPMVYRLGKVLNKYAHFKDAPEPVKQ